LFWWLFLCHLYLLNNLKQIEIMKTFKDLEFKNHPNPSFSTQATMNFDNGYGASVINGYGAYCNDDTYEVAVLFEDKLCYSTPITNDVIGYQSEEEVSEIMKQVQQLK